MESSYLDRLLALPVYLIRDLENFIKIQDCDKYLNFDMKVIEDVEAHNKALQSESEALLAEENKQGAVFMTPEYCSSIYDDLVEKF